MKIRKYGDLRKANSSQGPFVIRLTLDKCEHDQRNEDGRNIRGRIRQNKIKKSFTVLVFFIVFTSDH